MLQEILTQVEPILVDLAVAVIIAIVGILGVLLLKVKAWIISKIGEVEYNKAAKAAQGIWLWLRDNHPEWTGQQKMEEMQAMLVKKYPSLDQMELDSINKAVHEVFKMMEPVPPTEG